MVVFHDQYDQYDQYNQYNQYSRCFQCLTTSLQWQRRLRLGVGRLVDQHRGPPVLQMPPWVQSVEQHAVRLAGRGATPARHGAGRDGVGHERFLFFQQRRRERRDEFKFGQVPNVPNDLPRQIHRRHRQCHGQDCRGSDQRRHYCSLGLVQWASRHDCRRHQRPWVGNYWFWQH
jgi:hypothetical protein